MLEGVKECLTVSSISGTRVDCDRRGRHVPGARREDPMFNQLRRTTIATAAALAIVAGPATAPPVAAASSLSFPVVGTVPGGGTFSGAFALTSFAVKNGQVVAIGIVSGVVTNAA